jgi:hypothetical protein
MIMKQTGRIAIVLSLIVSVGVATAMGGDAHPRHRANNRGIGIE